MFYIRKLIYRFFPVLLNKTKNQKSSELLYMKITFLLLCTLTHFALNRGFFFQEIYMYYHLQITWYKKVKRKGLFISAKGYSYLNPVVDILSIRMCVHEANFNIAEVFCWTCLGQMKILAGPYILSQNVGQMRVWKTAVRFVAGS